MQRITINYTFGFTSLAASVDTAIDKKGENTPVATTRISEISAWTWGRE